MVDAEGFKLLVEAFTLFYIYAYLCVFALTRSFEHILRRLAALDLCYWFRLLRGIILVLDIRVDVLDIGSVEVVNVG